MKDYSKFVCISSESINFLIPSSQVITSVYCGGNSYFIDDNFVFENNLLPWVNFLHNDECNNTDSVETALILKNTMLFENIDSFALITSKRCSVIDIAFNKFSLFSERFGEKIRKKGIIACYFCNNKLYYLIDVEVLLKNGTL